MTDEKAPAPDAAGPAPEPHETVLAVTPVQIARFLLVVVVSLIVVGLATQLYVELLDGPPLRRLADRFDLDEEITVPTWYATVSLLFCASLIGIIGCAVRQQGGPYVRSWFGLAVIFALISIDEGASFHELSMRELRSAFDLPDYLHFAWVIPGSLVVITFVAIYFRFWWHLPPRSRWAFAVAAFLFVGGRDRIRDIRGLSHQNRGAAHPRIPAGRNRRGVPRDARCAGLYLGPPFSSRRYLGLGAILASNSYTSAGA